MAILTKERMKNWTLMFMSLVIALAIGELAARTISPDPVVPDPILGHKAEGKDRDADGFRNATVLEQADIIAIGDSQTEGNNATFDESWPQTLGRIASTSVYQLALGGWGPMQYGYLMDAAVKKKPKTIIVGFYLGNDLYDAYAAVYDQESGKSYRDPAHVPVQPAATSSRDFRVMLQTGLADDSLEFKIYQARLWVRHNVRLYTIAGDATRVLREKIGIALTREEKFDKISALAAEHPEVAFAYDAEPEIKTILSPSYRADTVDIDDPIAREGWRIAQVRYREIAERAKAEGIDLWVVIIPTKELVYLEHMRRKSTSIPESFETYEQLERKTIHAIEEFCVREKISCISALPRMADALDHGERAYGATMDGHPIARGYAAIAETLAEELRRRGVFPFDKSDPGMKE